MRASLKAAREESHHPLIRAEQLDITPPAHLPQPARSVVTQMSDESSGLREAVEQFQRQLILSSLEQHQGSWSQAARKLQLDRANLSRLAKRLGIKIQ